MARRVAPVKIEGRYTDRHSKAPERQFARAESGSLKLQGGEYLV